MYNKNLPIKQLQLFRQVFTLLGEGGFWTQRRFASNKLAPAFAVLHSFFEPCKALPAASLRQIDRCFLPPHSNQNKKAPHQDAFYFGGGRWIRTTEVSDNRFTVCPLWPLGNSPLWSWWSESNQQPADYKSAALPLSHTSKCAPLRATYGIIAPYSYFVNSFFQKNLDFDKYPMLSHSRIKTLHKIV